MLGKRILIDTSKCQACKACQVACKQWHSLEAEDTTFTGSYQNPPDMSGANLTVAKFIETEVGGKLRWLFFKDQCRHCEGAFCKGACPRNAIIRQANGIVRIDPVLCNGATCVPTDPKLCQSACPYNIPKREYVKDGSPVATDMRKCDFCYNRFGNAALGTKSRKPACQLTCPPGAILSGKADRMLKRAKNRVSYLKTHGHPYANVYPPQGDSWTWGPSHVIWVLTEKRSVYGL